MLLLVQAAQEVLAGRISPVSHAEALPLKGDLSSLTGAVCPKRSPGSAALSFSKSETVHPEMSQGSGKIRPSQSR